MGEKTGISWTDSTWNPWIGCTKVGPGCDHCYAVNVAARGGVEWGAGAARRRTSESNWKEPFRWNRKAEAFALQHGHPPRVFCASLADVFDNEVDDNWRLDALGVMQATPALRWQICTKRVSNIAKMVPNHWIEPPAFVDYSRGVPWAVPVLEHYWPQNVGILITVVTHEEINRDVPRLRDLKRRFGIPWIGLSIEPLIGDVSHALAIERLSGTLREIDWAILGGESGSQARPLEMQYLRAAAYQAELAGCAVFVKQMGNNPVDSGRPMQFAGKGADPSEWPADLRVQQFPPALC